jgi:hypothetical protein
LRVQTFGLEDFEPSLERQALHCARGGLHAAARRPVGLSENKGNFVSRLQQARKSACGEVRCAGED